MTEKIESKAKIPNKKCRKKFQHNRFSVDLVPKSMKTNNNVIQKRLIDIFVFYQFHHLSNIFFNFLNNFLKRALVESINCFTHNLMLFMMIL